MVFISVLSMMHAGTMRGLIRRHMVEGMQIHSYIHTRTDVNRNSDKSALVVSHVDLQQDPGAGLTFDLMALTFLPEASDT